MENQQLINLKSLIQDAFENCIYKEAHGDNDPNGVIICGLQEFIAQLTRDLEKRGIKIQKEV